MQLASLPLFSRVNFLYEDPHTSMDLFFWDIMVPTTPNKKDAFNRCTSGHPYITTSIYSFLLLLLFLFVSHVVLLWTKWARVISTPRKNSKRIYATQADFSSSTVYETSLLPILPLMEMQISNINEPMLKVVEYYFLLAWNR